MLPLGTGMAGGEDACGAGGIWASGHLTEGQRWGQVGELPPPPADVTARWKRTEHAPKQEDTWACSRACGVGGHQWPTVVCGGGQMRGEGVEGKGALVGGCEGGNSVCVSLLAEDSRPSSQAAW